MNAKQAVHCELTLMFTDIVGYSRLMGRDETMAIEMLGDYRKILLAHIAEQQGTFIEFAGDAIFARFDRAQDAVAAAVAIQKHLQVFNQGKEKGEPLLQTRIGLHCGSVLLNGDAVLGDDVNIAARLEPLAIPNGICISKAVYDQVRTELREPIKPLGLQSLKNIDHKIRAYLIKPSGITWRDHLHYFWRGCSKRMNAYRYPIAATVLLLIAAGFYFIPRWLVPGYAANYVEIANFQNLMNSDGKSDYFSNGITEAVRSQLADMRDVYLVEADKGIHAPIRLEGSVQKLGDNVRIAYRILRRKDNVQIAGGKLDGAYQDIFVLQDRLVGEIAKYLASEFKLQNFRPAPLKLTSDVTAYDYYLQGMADLRKPLGHQNIDDAIQKFTQALINDKNFVRANAGMCDAYRQKYQLTKTAKWVELAETYCFKVLAQEDMSSKSYESIGSLYRELGRYSDAINFLKQATNMEPDNISAVISLARAYDLMGNITLAESLYLGLIEKNRKNWEVYHGYAYFLVRQGRYEAAIENYQNALKLTPENSVALYNIGGVYLYLGEFGRAAQSLERATALEPTSGAFSNAGTMYYFSGNYQQAIVMYEKALRIQPAAMEVIVGIADAYNFIPSGRSIADRYFRDAMRQAEDEIKSNSGSVLAYQTLAFGYMHFTEYAKSESELHKADQLDPDNTVSYYARLRLAVFMKSDSDIDTYTKKLIEKSYSEKLIVSDPYFSLLKKEKYKKLFNNVI